MSAAVTVALPPCTDGEAAWESGMWDVEKVPLVKEVERGPYGEARYLVNAQGIRLATYHWPVRVEANHKPLRGVVVLVHGYAVHITYTYFQSNEVDPPKPYDGSWVHRMNQEGYAVWGIDNQSCGRSEGIKEGLKMFFHRFDDLCDDVEQLCMLLKKHPVYCKYPLFLMGNSMGGNISLHVSQALHEKGLLQGTILLSPMITINSLKSTTFNRLLLPIARVCSYFLPSMKVVVSSGRDQKHVLLHQQYENDPLNFHGAARMLVAVLTVQQCEKTVQMLDRFNFPFFILQSEHDEICDPSGAEMLYERAASKVKKLNMLSDPDSFHMLSTEPMHLEVLDEVLDWLECRLHPSNNDDSQ